ncbi:MAG: hypothetical protein U9Q04_09970 [Campylobacterota bacterium]|nr:hypothetical protein [Campylobacterota bacterium]
MKKITFHINHSAYTVDLGADPDNTLEDGLKKFLTTDSNLSTEDLLLAYMRKTQELIHFEKKLKNAMLTIPSIKQFETDEDQS